MSRCHPRFALNQRTTAKPRLYGLFYLLDLIGAPDAVAHAPPRHYTDVVGDERQIGICQIGAAVDLFAAHADSDRPRKEIFGGKRQAGGAGVLQQLGGFFRRNITARTAALLRLHPAINAGNVFAGDLSNDFYAACFFDHGFRRFELFVVHGRHNCDNRERPSIAIAIFAIA